MIVLGPKKPRVHTDTCARCGCDRKEQRRGQFRCKANGVLYSSHKWGWDAVKEEASEGGVATTEITERGPIMRSRP